ncbi:MAG TPA: DUF4105 domain-containing protein [Gemmatimonadaceae bacterium]|nr:DUF4105 domain-containing protein [Gemmatimonadaceae bacterium]
MRPNGNGRSKVRGQRSPRAICIGLALLAAHAPPVEAQVAPPDSAALGVWLMTMGPGDAVWERFGHNAIRIRDERTGDDRVYNWGMFSLDQSGFILRFLRGRMRYWMASEDAAATAEAYRQHNRSVTIQQLNLTGAQKLALYAFVQRNELPENRYYDYDYFRDNCSTRVRDALDAALGGILAAQFRNKVTDMSYRDHARRLMQPDIWTYTGIDIGLGRPTDRKITAWEEMFVPMSVQRLMREVQIKNAMGADVPLVVNERVVVEANRPAIPDRPAEWTIWYLLAGVLIAAGILACVLTRAEPVAYAMAYIWCIVAGLLGTLLLLLWVATQHVAAHQNANLLSLNPLWLVLGGMAVARSRKARAFSLVLTGIAFVGLLLWLLPNQQDTRRVLALVLPIHAAVMLTIARRVRLVPR